MRNSFAQPVCWTLTPALAPGASENADFADSERKKSALVCVHLRPAKVKEEVAHEVNTYI